MVSRPPARQRRRRRLRGGAGRRTGRRLSPAWSSDRGALLAAPHVATAGGRRHHEKPLGASGFVDWAPTTFSAKDSFEAILDTSSGPFYGGGGQVNLPLNLFARVDVTRFKKDGERAFVTHQWRRRQNSGSRRRSTMTPIELTGGYRRPLTFGRRGGKPGARPSQGFTHHSVRWWRRGRREVQGDRRLRAAGRRCDESFTSYHFIGGVEVPLWKFVGVGAEYHHRWVPDALGTGGVSEQFNETDLGGWTFRFRLTFGI